MASAKPAPAKAPAHSKPAPAGNAGGAPSSDARTLGLVAHLLLIFSWWLGPLILWLLKREEGGFVERQAREALNFGITLMIVYVAVAILAAIMDAIFAFGTVLPGPGPFAGLPGLVWVAGLVFGILAAIAANKGEDYRYPVTLRLVPAPGTPASAT